MKKFIEDDKLLYYIDKLADVESKLLIAQNQVLNKEIGNIKNNSLTCKIASKSSTK